MTQHDRLNVWWDEAGFWFGLHTLLDPVRVPYFRQALLSHKKDSRVTVLDLGSGGGFVASGLGDVAHITAFDPSFHSVLEAKASGVPAAAVGLGEILPFGAEVFDAVICSEVLEHVNDPAKVVAEVSRVMAPDGVFMFSTPNRSVWSRLLLIDVAQRWAPSRILPSNLHEWERFLTRKLLLDLLNQNGFEVRDLTGISLPLWAWPSAIATLVSVKTGQITLGDAGRRIKLGLSRNMRVAMIGWATKNRRSMSYPPCT